ncbi:substrate-binding periplasmic protein [Paludibacterium purpuratum]|uniref:ABC-type amino acid transport substrate-binding protein n=1 Tax=Paludibacterium purpuratum TaxID=1144873 RepID=A0A4R7AX03_9NEIS|nr:transporter substrate-binding domain-containing protein [Paludibacterium purpuratum]TDR72064.1 ABC-type amino acid transport substrate-binding protein [Paludibacterium purpuratum]
MKRWLVLLGCLWWLPVAAKPFLLCAEPWYPFIYQDAGQARGLLVDALQRQPDVRIRYRFMGMAGCEKLMRQGQVDLAAFATMSHLPPGWLNTRQTLVTWVLYAWVPLKSPVTHFSPEAFAGKRLAWIDAYDYPETLDKDQQYRRVPAVDSVEAVALLANGRIDLMLDDPFVTQDVDPVFARAIRRLPEVVASKPQPLALRPGLGWLRDRIDRGVQQMRDDGSLDAFYQFHFGAGLQALSVSDKP